MKDLNFSSQQFSHLPAWLQEQKKNAWQSFRAQGLPSAKHERWKYIDFSALENLHFTSIATASPQPDWPIVDDSHLLAITNGSMNARVSANPSYIISTIAQACVTHSELLRQYWPEYADSVNDAFAKLALAFFNDGLFLYVPDGMKVELPCHLYALTNQENFHSNLFHIIILGKNSELTLLEQHECTVNQYLSLSATQVILQENAKLNYFKFQNQSSKSHHLARTLIRQERNSVLIYGNFSAGALVARDDTTIYLTDEGAKARAYGFYRLHEDQQYIDNHLSILHQASYCHSEMTYKGILDNHSRAVFNGHLLIEKETKGTIASQANHNLLLAKLAEVYSKPELEIYADDVQCRHGATIGQLDENALFYLCSRGIKQTQAKAILMHSFADDVLNKITHSAFEQCVRARISL